MRAFGAGYTDGVGAYAVYGIKMFRVHQQCRKFVAVLVESEQKGRQAGDDHRRQRRWHAFGITRHKEHHRRGADRQDDRWPVCGEHQVRNFQQLFEEARGLRFAAEDLADLADQDRQRNAVEQTDDDRLGQEVGQATEAKEARRQAEDAGQQRQRDAVGQVEAAIAGGQRRDHRGQHGAGGGVRADDQLPRGAGEGIHHHRHEPLPPLQQYRSPEILHPHLP